VNKRCFFIAGALLITINASAQSVVDYASYWDQYLVSTMSMPDYHIPGEAVYNALQSSDGFVWLVCATGIVRYDGISTKVFGPNNENYRGSTLYEMHEDKNGNYWLPTIGEGLMKFRDGTFSHYNANHGLKSNIIKSLAITQGDTLWLGTYGAGIQAFYQDTVVASYNTDNGLIHDQVWRLMIDDKNRLWIGTNGGISILENGEFKHFTVANGLPYNIIRGLTQMINGDIWVGTDKEGIVVFRDDVPVEYYNRENGLNGDYPQYFAQNPADSSIWVAHHGVGVDRFHNGRFEGMTTDDGLVSGLSTFVKFTKEGLAIIGSEKGVTILKKRKIDVVNTKQGITENILINVIEDSTGTVWLGTEGKGFNYKTPTGWGVVEYPPDVTNGYASGGAVDRDGNVWFNTKGTGTVKIVNHKVEASYTSANASIADFSRGLAFDYENNAWIGTNGGVSIIYKNAEIKTISSEEGLPTDFIMTTISASDSSIWVGMFGGAAVRFKNGKMDKFGLDEGLLSDKVYVIMEDSRGNIWTSGAQSGLSLIIDDEVTSFDGSSGIPAAGFNALVEDDFGYLWLATGGSIFRMKMQDLYDFKDGAIRTIPSVRYTMEDGFPAISLEIGYSSTAIKQTNGDVLFATKNGLAVIDPKKFVEPSPVIQPYIDEIRVNGEIRSFSESIVVNPGNNVIEISYSAFNFAAPSKTQFRVKLSGITSDWVYMDQRRTVYYDFLPDGDYIFQVEATNADGQWHSTVAGISFKVLPPYYKTWWFMGLSLIAFGGVIAFIVRIRYKSKMKELNREIAVQHQIQVERERISRDLHDNVGVQITNLITGLEIGNLHVQKKQNDEAISVLKNLDTDARGAMTELRETIWLLDRKRVKISEFEKHVNSFFKRQEYCLNGLKLQFTNKVDRDLELNPTQSLHLLRIIQEALNNCRKYAKSTFFKVTLSQNNSFLEVIIEDDGIGMSIDDVSEKGNGLTNMRRRTVELDGSIDFESAPKRGLKIFVMIPLSDVLESKESA
jgi:signal transduction histidine kinase/ligand-binding sensor domain-containing protein